MEKLCGTFFWWWIIHHSVHHYGLLVGHFPFYNPEVDFEDEELGIPPDSDGLAPVIENVRSVEIPGCNTPGQQFYPPLMLRNWFGEEGIWKF